ncbi:MAG TPA: chromate transporter [Chthonomonadales bacterium]|nr:chromate transporter [Chthonomonadales bacterium]
MSSHPDQDTVTPISTTLSLSLEQPSSWTILRVWLAAGGQSFGGGVATLALIRRAVVEEHRWLTPDEFTRDWALCQMAPGINLFALAILIGRRLAGVKGIFLALLGLLLPSVTMALLITAFFAHIHRLETTQAVLRGIIPATVGLGLLTAAQMARPLLATSRREGSTSLLWSILLLIGSGLAVTLVNLSVILVLCVSGLMGAVFSWWQYCVRREKEETRK